MSTFYLDYENGSDAADGTSFANRWKTLKDGATAARITAGDEIRVIASPEPTLVGDVEWAGESNTITLAAAVTESFDLSTGATTSTGVSVAGAGLGTGGTTDAITVTGTGSYAGTKAAYWTLGAATDLSGYQQLSLWYVYTSGGFDMKISLCSDTTGDTPVNEITLPRTRSGVLRPVVIDLTVALGSSIQSIALRSASGGAFNITLGNLTACKAPSAADAITHNSLLGKANNLAWAASTAYALNDVRKPLPVSRNGWCYKATTAGTSGGSEPVWPDVKGATVSDGSVVWTCFDLEEIWYPVMKFDGLYLDLDIANYPGDSETVATYVRQPLLMPDAFTGDNCNANGGIINPIQLIGGWNRTDMSTRTGETWVSARTKVGTAIGPNVSSGLFKEWLVRGMNFVRYGTMLALNGGTIRLDDVGVTASAIALDSIAYLNEVKATGFRATGCHSGPMVSAVLLNGDKCRLDGIGSRGRFPANNSSNGRGVWTNTAGSSIISGGVVNLTRSASKFCSHTELALSVGGPHFISEHTFNPDWDNSLSVGSDVTVVNSYGPWTSLYANWSVDITSDARNTRLTFQDITDAPNVAGQFLNAGSILADAGLVHSSSPFSWKFSMGGSMGAFTSAVSDFPLAMPIAKLLVKAGVPTSLQVWTYRDTGNIAGRLVVKGGQVAGVNTTVKDVVGGTSTWVQTSALTITPTADGVIEVLFETYTIDGNTTDSIWVDDLTVT